MSKTVSVRIKASTAYYYQNQGLLTAYLVERGIDTRVMDCKKDGDDLVYESQVKEETR